MRPYRGKRVDTGEWVRGGLVKSSHGVYNIIPEGASEWYGGGIGKYFYGVIEVHPNTVGQSTGMPDETGALIFAGDRIKVGNFLDPVTVFWDEKKAAYYVTTLKGCRGPRLLCDLASEIHNIVTAIGTIHDTPPDAGGVEG